MSVGLILNLLNQLNNIILFNKFNKLVMNLHKFNILFTKMYHIHPKRALNFLKRSSVIHTPIM